jgi:hypothetical protein
MIPLIDDHYSYIVVRSLYFSPDIPRPTKYGKSVLKPMAPAAFLSVERSQCGMTVQAGGAPRVLGASAEALEIS